jgi:glycosyltransferase involved in cell wall biosynthesis
MTSSSVLRRNPIRSDGLLAGSLTSRQYPYEPTSKDRSVVSIGRFISGGHAKRQDVLLDAWTELAGQLPDWRLHLIDGGPARDSYVTELIERAAGLPRVTVSLDLVPADLAKALACAGGPGEIVQPGFGVVWRTVDQLIEETIALASDADRRRTMQAAASVAARRFSRDVFERRLDELVRADGVVR